MSSVLAPFRSETGTRRGCACAELMLPFALNSGAGRASAHNRDGVTSSRGLAGLGRGCAAVHIVPVVAGMSLDETLGGELNLVVRPDLEMSDNTLVDEFGTSS